MITKNKKLLFSIITIFVFIIPISAIEYIFSTEDRLGLNPISIIRMEKKSKNISSLEKTMRLHWKNAIFENTLNKKNGYSVRYYFDEFARRKLPIDKTKPKHFLIFGGSNSFGQGLTIDQTIGFKINKFSKIFQPYYYAHMGYAAGQMLYYLENTPINNQVHQQSGIAIYFMFDFHILRTSVNRHVYSWRRGRAPYYVMDDQGQVKLNGTFRENNKLIYTLYDLQLRSVTYNFLEDILHQFIPEKDKVFAKDDIDLFCAIIKKAENIYDQKFSNSKFIVASISEIPKGLKQCFIDKNISFFKIPYPHFPESERSLYYFSDGHLNEKYVDHIVDFTLNLIKDIYGSY